MYVIVKSETGEYVNQPGAHNSYTRNICAAKKSQTEEDARQDCCGNEYPSKVNIDEVMQVNYN